MAAFQSVGVLESAEQVDRVFAVKFRVVPVQNGDPAFARTLFYELSAHAWLPSIKAYLPQPHELPQAIDASVRFETTARVSLRATAAVNDASEETAGPGEDRTPTLRGNVVAVYGAHARGWAIARKGAFWFVGFDPQVPPEQTSLRHSADEDSRSTWLCGWVHAADVRQAP